MVTTINAADQSITQYNLQTGGANNLLNNVAPSATSGVPIISQGASAQPIFGTAVVAGGGTGATSFTAHGALFGNGTSAVFSGTAAAAGQGLIMPPTASIPQPNYFTNTWNTYIPQMNALPIMTNSAGAAAAVTINTYNIWAMPQFGGYFEVYNTTASTNVAPTVTANTSGGLNLDNITGAVSKTIEIAEGATANSKNAFVLANLQNGCYVSAGFRVTTLADVKYLYVGFRKAQAYQATIPTGYTDYVVMGLTAGTGEVHIYTQAASGGNSDTDTTNSVSAGSLFTIKIINDINNGLSFLLNNVAVGSAPSYNWGIATVVPFIIYQTASGAHAEVDLVSYTCGQY
jgi:hypothetical protein